MYNHYGSGVGVDPSWVVAGLALAAPFIIIVLLWSIFWKGLALWHSARRGEPLWFIIMLIVNTVGILEIVYLFGIAKLKVDELFTFKEHGHHH